MDDARRISDLADRLGRIARSLQFSRGLNPAQWEALRFLARANRYSCSPSALAEFLGVTKGTASQTLIALEAKGYIQRGPCPHDRRSVAICVTEAGQKLLENDPLRCLQTATRALSSQELSALVEGMEHLIRTLQRSQGLPEFGACGNCRYSMTDQSCGTGAGAPCRCALNGDLLTPEEQHKMCVDFRCVE